MGKFKEQVTDTVKVQENLADWLVDHPATGDIVDEASQKLEHIAEDYGTNGLSEAEIRQAVIWAMVEAIEEG